MRALLACPTSRCDLASDTSAARRHNHTIKGRCSGTTVPVKCPTAVSAVQLRHGPPLVLASMATAASILAVVRAATPQVRYACMVLLHSCSSNSASCEHRVRLECNRATRGVVANALLASSAGTCIVGRKLKLVGSLASTGHQQALESCGPYRPLQLRGAAQSYAVCVCCRACMQI
jgi:hypothetical protein